MYIFSKSKSFCITYIHLKKHITYINDTVTNEAIEAITGLLAYIYVSQPDKVDINI